MVNIAKFFLEFTQDESCGKCTPCRVGTKVMLDILKNICAGRGAEGDVETLEDLSVTIKNASLCGLGQTAPNPVLTTIRYFRDEYDAHIRDKICPAVSCTDLIKFEVVSDLCKKCGKCKIKDLVGLSEKYHMPISVATGGTLARRIVVEKRPDVIIAVACERDLTSGIQDSYPIPVFGILNMRPFGPCYDTDIDLDLVEKGITTFLGNENG